MDKQTATAIAQFMGRVTLQGAEVAAWQTCMNALGEIIERPETEPTEIGADNESA